MTSTKNILPRSSRVMVSDVCGGVWSECRVPMQPALRSGLTQGAFGGYLAGIVYSAQFASVLQSNSGVLVRQTIYFVFSPAQLALGHGQYFIQVRALCAQSFSSLRCGRAPKTLPVVKTSERYCLRPCSMMSYTCTTLCRRKTTTSFMDLNSLRRTLHEWQTRTGSLKPMEGMGSRLSLHLAQNECPHLRQWCWRLVKLNATWQLKQLGDSSRAGGSSVCR